MKYFYEFFILSIMLACNPIQTNNSKKEIDISSLKGMDAIKKIHEKFKFKDSIEVLWFKEDFQEEFPYYHYTFIVFDGASEYHVNYRNRIKFQFEKDVDFSLNDNSKNWDGTNDSLQLVLRNEYKNILLEWIPISYYKGNLILNEADHGGYCFTDSLVFDKTFSDETDAYYYQGIKNKSKNHIELILQHISKEVKKNDTIDLYFLSDEMVAIRHHTKYLDGGDGWYLLVPYESVKDYPIVVYECSELPIEIKFDEIDFSNLISNK